MKVRLTRKYADAIDGVDLRSRSPGDLLDLPVPEARLLLAEEWAIPERRQAQASTGQRRRAEDHTT